MRPLSVWVGVLALFVLSSLGCGEGSTQGVDPELTREMEEFTDAFVAERIDENDPGLVISVIGPAGVVFEKAYGMANIDKGLPLALDTPFELASLSKQFTATAVMMLYEEGELALDDSLASYFADAPDAWSSITLHHVLSHQSGIPEFDNRVPVSSIIEWKNEDVLEWAKGQPLLFAPGEGFEYANTGYVLLALIIEEVTDAPFAELVARRILEPLAMEDSLVSDVNPPDIPNRALSYFQSTSPYEFPYYFTGMTSQWSSMEDLKRWDVELRNVTLIDEETFALMTSPHAPQPPPFDCDYGYGWDICEEDVGVEHRHTGQWYGFFHGIRRIQNHGLTLIGLSNGHTLWIFDLLGEPLVDIYLSHQSSE